MKILKVYKKGKMGFKKYTIWIEDGNTLTKIGTFVNKDSIILFMKWCEEQGIKFIVHTNERDM